MKIMTCHQMGGPCNVTFMGKTANEVVRAQSLPLKEAVAA
jgi:hypothetical protein